MKALLFFTCFMLNVMAFAQNKTLGVGTPTPNTNAALHVESPGNNQGFIMPRLTTAQRTAMTLGTTDIGLQLYDTDLKGIFVWDGTVWKNGGSSLPLAATVNTALGAFVLTNTGTGSAGNFNVDNPSSTAPALFATSNSNNNGDAIRAVQTGTGGTAANFALLNTANWATAVIGTTEGTGIAGYFEQKNQANGGSALMGITRSDLGGALAPVGVYGESSGTGSVGGAFWTTNAANAYPALYAKSLGTGSSIYSETSNGFATLYALQSSSLANKHAIIGKHDGTGNGLAGLFQNTNAANAYPAIQAETAGIGPGVKVLQSPTSLGSGVGVFLQNTTSTATGLIVDNQGLNVSGLFKINNAANTSQALYAETNGTNSAGHFENSNTTATASGVVGRINSNAGGTGVNGFSTGTAGHGGAFDITNASNSYPAIVSRTTGTGSAGDFQITNTSNSNRTLVAITNGTGGAGGFTTSNPANLNTALTADTNGIGLAFGATASATSNAGAGQFDILNPSNTKPAIKSQTNGTGPALQLIQSNNGNALEIIQGAMKLSVAAFAAPGTITTKAILYELSGSGTVNLPVSGPVGETCWVSNPTGGPITVNSVAVSNGTIRQFIRLSGGWQIVN